MCRVRSFRVSLVPSAMACRRGASCIATAAALGCSGRLSITSLQCHHNLHQFLIKNVVLQPMFFEQQLDNVTPTITRSQASQLFIALNLIELLYSCDTAD